MPGTLGSTDIFVVDILENEINRVAIGAEVIINFPSMSKRNFLGSVVSISPDVDVNTSAGQVVISINTHDAIKSGMFAEVKIETENLGEKLRKMLIIVKKSHQSFERYPMSGYLIRMESDILKIPLEKTCVSSGTIILIKFFKLYNLSSF